MTFKVGDKVRRVTEGNPGENMHKGLIYIVREVGIRNNHIKIEGSSSVYYAPYFELVKEPEPAVYSVRQVADAIHAITGTSPQPEYEERIALLNKHLAKVNDPDWKKYQELKEKFKDA